jgi:hypothetical protein
MKQVPHLSFEISEKEPGVLEVETANLNAVTVNFYIVDAEILFSRTPFIKSNSAEFSYVKPFYFIEKTFEVNPDGDSAPAMTKIMVPDHLKLKNMVIEVTGNGY